MVSVYLVNIIKDCGIDMSNLHKHALAEFRAAGWTDENGKFEDDMQEAICTHILKLLDVFADEGHSGSTAPYTVDLFKKLAMFEPLVPLTGEDWEWVDVAEQSGRTLWQNKRCSHIFKDVDGAYDIDGIVFYEWYTSEETGEKHRSYFTSRESRVPVTFPYTPKTEYKEWIEK
jgi:hypothetical protein